MKAEIVAIGTELTSGQSLDTNSQWLSSKLGESGVEVHYHTTLADDLEENVQALRIAAGRADLVLVSGGLGPTQDDLTREALAKLAGVKLVLHEQALVDLEAFFARRNRPMPERNRVQALLPEGALPLANPIGTAPGVWMTIGRSVFAAMPGVPRELKQMYDEQVKPRIEALLGSARVIRTRKINLFGKGESEIESIALDLTARGRKPEVGITASEATISFRIVAEGQDENEANEQLESTARLIYERFGDLIIGEGSEDVADGLVQELAKAGSLISTAESCTGGLIGHLLTSIPGVSATYPGGVVSYSNDVKMQLLGVPKETLEEHGAVSAETAAAMAEGVRQKLGANLGLSVTGIAGPGGGSPTKPVGLVYLGLADGEIVQTKKLELGPEQPREIIQMRSAKHAINWARLHLRKKRMSK